MKEAEEKMAENKFDLIISEFELPQKSGIDFLKDLRGKKDETPFNLFIFKEQEEIATEALDLGTFGFVKKQTNAEIVHEELSNKIKLLVKHQKTRGFYKKCDIVFSHGPGPQNLFQQFHLNSSWARIKTFSYD